MAAAGAEVAAACGAAAAVDSPAERGLAAAGTAEGATAAADIVAALTAEAGLDLVRRTIAAGRRPRRGDPNFRRESACRTAGLATLAGLVKGQAQAVLVSARAEAPLVASLAEPALAPPAIDIRRQAAINSAASWGYHPTKG